MPRIYGNAPTDLGLIDISPTEMMFWLYLPVKLPGSVRVHLPPNLEQFRTLVADATLDAARRGPFWDFVDSYAYLTAKTMYVSPDIPGNRPGWHSDGFMTDDVSYIWSDRNPTEFWEPEDRYSFTQHHKVSLQEMDSVVTSLDIETYPDKHLLRLDQTVIHRVAPVMKPGVRTFVKVSISKDKYDLVGNSVNHELAPDWTYHPRSAARNAPASAEAKL